MLSSEKINPNSNFPFAKNGWIKEMPAGRIGMPDCLQHAKAVYHNIRRSNESIKTFFRNNTALTASAVGWEKQHFFKVRFFQSVKITKLFLLTDSGIN